MQKYMICLFKLSMLKERKICVSIPLIDNDFKYLEDTISKAKTAGAHLFEFRFDFIENLDNLEKFIEIVSKERRRSIFTVRPIGEGGYFKGNEEDRKNVLMKVGKIYPLFLDVEYNFILNNEEFADFIESNNIRIIVSWHNFSETPKNDELIELINKMMIYSNYIKIVTTANNFQNSLDILNLYQLTKESKINLLAFSMGEYGILSRVLSSVIGNAPFIYATLGRPLAPGQIKLDQIQQLYSMLKSKLI